MFISNPHKANEQALVGRYQRCKYGFLVTKGFAYLSFHAVAVNGMLEALLGDADKHLRCNVALLAGNSVENGPQGIGHKSLTSATKEHIYQPCADNMLSLRETISSTSHLFNLSPSQPLNLLSPLVLNLKQVVLQGTRH